MAKSLEASSLIESTYKKFLKISDPRSFDRKTNITLSDHLMSGLAIFGLKFPSLLSYDRSRKDPEIERNLKTLYHVETPPSNTYLAERLDLLDPKSLRPAFKNLFAKLQRSKKLEQFEFLDGHYLLSLDGTGQFSSGKISCPNCCVKNHKSGKQTFYHQMLGASIVCPEQSNVIPLCPEIIQKSDGDTKNDCERNAAKRFINNFRREHPHLKVIVLEDGLSSNGPHINTLRENNMSYILGAKPGDHEYLFELLYSSDKTKYFEFKDDKGFFHQFQFINNVSLNKSNPEVIVNFFEYRETDPNGKETNFSWVTDIKITEENILQLSIGGRTRWKIENETYNMLKNLGYHFEHNYGHGKKHLSTIFCLLMLLAFLIDQIQEIACSSFQAIRKKTRTYYSLWERMRVIFEYKELLSWEHFYQVIMKKKLLDSS